MCILFVYAIVLSPLYSVAYNIKHCRNFIVSTNSSNYTAHIYGNTDGLRSCFVFLFFFFIFYDKLSLPESAKCSLNNLGIKDYMMK